jgi:hypothetical protein
MTLSEADKDAMARAIALMQSGSRRDREQIGHYLATESWERSGEFAAYVCQDRSLKLRPWAPPPCWMRKPEYIAAALARPYGIDGERQAGELARDLIAAGLSIFESDPLAALEQTESARRDERVVGGKLDRAQPPPSHPEPR